MFKFWQRQYHPRVFLESEKTTTGINRSPDYKNEHGVRRYQWLFSWFWETDPDAWNDEVVHTGYPLTSHILFFEISSSIWLPVSQRRCMKQAIQTCMEILHAWWSGFLSQLSSMRCRVHQSFCTTWPARCGTDIRRCRWYGIFRSGQQRGWMPHPWQLDGLLQRLQLCSLLFRRRCP